MSNPSSKPIPVMSVNSTRMVVLVAIVAVLLPVTLRVVASPIALIILAPVIFVLLALSFFACNLYLGYILDLQRKRKTNRLYQAAKPLSFSTPAAWQAVLTRSQWSQNLQQTFPPLDRESPEISEALEDIISKIIRDFVHVWYDNLSTSSAFPSSVNALLHSAAEALLDRSAAIDLPALIVRRIIPKITTHIEHFRQSEVALRGAGLERRFTQSEELDLLLAGRYANKGHGKLHPAIENLSTTFTKQTEEIHLRNLVESALPHILPENAANSRAVTIVIREIVTCSVLHPVMDMITEPDFWNRSIDHFAGAAIHQQKLISKIRNVLEAQSPRAVNRVQVAPLTNPSMTERITTRTDARQFESFLRSISRCASLLDARRLKNDIAGEIRRTRMSLANHDKEDWINGEKTEDVVAFLDRLYTAKRKVEERIVVLGGGEDNSRQSSALPEASKPTVSLRDILRNPNSLSYFMEFMDRRNRSLPVQFWLTVESFKNPLESVESDSSGDEEEFLQDLETSVNVKEDISMIHDLYFADPSVPSGLSSIARKHIDRIRSFVREVDPSPASQRTVRRSVLLAQKQMERDMEQDFEEFERSELWFRAVGDAGFATQQKGLDPFAATSSATEDVNILPTHAPSRLRPPTPSQPRASSRNIPSNQPMQRAVSSTSSASAKSGQPGPSNIEVLMSPISDAFSDSSRTPLFNDPEDEAQREEQKRMEAIHAAVTDIMALEQEREEPLQEPGTNFDQPARASTPRLDKARGRMFDDVPLGLEEDEGEYGEGDGDGAGESQTFQLAAPGDLQLSYEIGRLTDKINNLNAQEEMLDTLIRKAELTGDTQELVLLRKSKAAMNRDLRELEFQRQQYEQQESANKLVSDRTRVSIVSSTTAEEDGKSVVRYLVEVQQLGTDGGFSSGWVVARRYNEFLSMHTKLRERYALVRALDFPGKRLVASLAGSFLDNRKQALEKYLQGVIAIPVVCESAELRTFLSRDSPFLASTPPTSKTASSFSGTDLVRNVYRSVAESIDDMFFGPSMLDVMIQRLTRQAAEFAGIVGSGINDEDLVAQALHASGKSTPESTLLLTGDLKPLEGESSTSLFSAPICDLVLAVFELNKQNNWLRRQAVVIILQQVLGGTIERKVRDSVKDLVGTSQIMRYINIFRDSLWPGGKVKGPSIPRTAEEKIRTRDEANRKLSSLVPDLAANMIGRSNARRGARRMFAVLQNRRLNQHIAYTIVDEIFAALFPESLTA
ncbi:structural protein MDM1 [Coprinopsis marcescibilis]|uniref:Structural protein MDM1 n=1 Tax=Coprinopsis marcescibilis TaxID=230819 RepID=A0A5C3KJE1_COPMA|nr:structural protein MDM1 [Coprinopsis marcescibilis]